MDWKKECLKNFRLYAITDLRTADRRVLDRIRGAFRGGVDILQLRSKALPDRTLLDLGTKIRPLARKFGRLFIVNDRIDLMLALEADGVHLGQDDLPIECARRIIGNRSKLIGCSTHNLKQALEAERKGADYIGFGPIFQTPTKPDYRPVGLRAIREVARRVRIPVVCIGGIDRSNIQEVVRAGAKRIAVVRAVFSAPDSYQAAFELRRLLKAVS